jgi:hypothetical protein
MFSRLEDLVEGNNVETSDTGIDQWNKGHLVNLQSRFSKYRPEAVSDKHKWITDQFHADSSRNYEFSLEKEKQTVLILHLLLLQKFGFLGSPSENFGWALEGSCLTLAGRL